jgi:hypothetical protein
VLRVDRVQLGVPSGFRIAATLLRYEFIRSGPAVEVGVERPHGDLQIETRLPPRRLVKEPQHVSRRLKLVR